MEQQGASGWYGGSQQQQQYGGHPHPHPHSHSHPPMQWQVRPETTQHYNQPPQMHPSQQQQQQHQYQQAYPTAGGYYGQSAGYYASQQQQVPQSSAPQPAVPPPLSQQHGMMYGQAEQAWPSSNGWSQQQWPSAEDTQPGNSTAGLSQEEEWAAKARAWAASKAAQDAQQHSQLHVQTQPDQSNLQQLPLPPPPPPPPPQPVDMSQQFAYQAHEAGTPAYGHDISHKYGQDSPGLFGRDASSRIRGEEMKSFALEGSTSGSGLATTPAPPLPPTSRNISELGTSSYSQDMSSSHGQNVPPADVTVPPGMEQLETPQPPAPPPPPPAAAASLSHLPHQQPPQLASQISPHQQTAHIQPHMPPSQFSFGEPSVPAPYDFHQQPPYEFQQSQPQEYPHPQPSQFNMAPDAGEAGAYGGLPHPQTWPPQMSYPANNMGPGIGAGPGLGHQFDYEFEHMHPGHQHPQHLQGHTMFSRPPHGPGFRPGGPPLGHFGFGNNPTLGPGAGTGMDFSMFTDNGYGLNAGLERPKKASVPNWLKEELLKKKAAVGGGAQLSVAEDNARANGDNMEASTHNKFELSDRSRSDLSRMSDSDDEDEEDDTEAARTAAMNQEIKRVLTEVLLKVTDDLFDEIAQEVMDEDEQRLLEDPSKKAPLAEDFVGTKVKSSTHAPILDPVPALAPAPVRVHVAPPVKRSEDDSDDDSESLSSGAPAGNLLGLASYASDDEDAGRNSRQVTGSKHGNGGHSDTEASELKSVAPEKGGKTKYEDTEDQVVIAKEVKGKKRLSEEDLNSDHSGRSPRRARHSEISGDEVDQKDLATSINPGVTVHQVKTGVKALENLDMGITVEGRGLQTAPVKEVASENKSNHKASPHNALSTERRKLEGGYDYSSKGRSGEDSSHLRRAEKEVVPSGKHKQGTDIDLGKTVKDRDYFNAKQGAKEAEGDTDHKNGIKWEKDLNRDEKDRVRENKQKDRDRESLRGKERERNVQKLKERDRESDLEKQKEKDKDRGRSTKARARDSDRERRKSTSEKHDRKSTEYKKEKEKNSKKARRRRSSSLSSRSRSRSRSRSESNSASGSRSSSPSPRRGKQQKERSSKKSSHSSPPLRSRRRTSRSPSRSMPHSKVSHRRHSPSLSREKERMGHILLGDSETGSRGQHHQPTRGDGADGGSGVFGITRILDVL